MFHTTRTLMGHNMEGNRIKVMVKGDCSVGHVVRSILKGIVHKIRVVGLKFRVHKKRRQLGMLGREFHEIMKSWITSQQITRQWLSIWIVNFVIKLFPF